jgi:glycosyltransferase involved in cell wall biosynthesis
VSASQGRLAVFLATSGHSGVDRVMGNLIPEIARRGVAVDLLQIEGHGPHLATLPDGVEPVPLGCRHVDGSLPALVRYLRRRRPQVLFSDKDRLNRMALIARRLAGTPPRVVIRVGTTVSQNLQRRGWLHRRLQLLSIRLLYPWAQAIIVPSRGAAADLAAIGHLPQGLVHVLPSPVGGAGLDALAAAPLEHAWFAPDAPPVILGVGELCARKDFETLLRAFARLRRLHPCRLMILGEGRRRARLETLAHALGIEGDVALPGFVTNPYPYMARCALLALSSTCEGSPVVLLEALALGRPVVATDCPSGPRETLQEGALGALVPVGDERALAVAMARTLAHPPDRERLRQCAEAFSVCRAADRYLEVLGVDARTVESCRA